VKLSSQQALPWAKPEVVLREEIPVVLVAKQEAAPEAEKPALPGAKEAVPEE
jgi:hypothetical protein